MINFGAGVMLAFQKTNASGVAVTNATPIQFGVLQDVNLDISFEERLLYGANQYPVAFGRGKATVTGKATVADINGRIYGDLFLGTGTTATIRDAVIDFAATVPATPHTVTVTPPQSGTYLTDFGVRFAATGMPLTKVASAPAAGQYAVNTSTRVYTFAAADANVGVLISYEYSAVSTTARLATINNVLMGQAPTFEVLLNNPYGGKVQQVKLPTCMSNKLAMPFKNDDFSMVDFEFTAIADASGNVGYIATSE
jgi:hypothetical protein